MLEPATSQSQGRLLDLQGSPSERPLDTVGSSSEEEVGRPRWSSSSMELFFLHGALILDTSGLPLGAPSVSLGVSDLRSHREAPRQARGVWHGCDMRQSGAMPTWSWSVTMQICPRVEEYVAHSSGDR